MKKNKVAISQYTSEAYGGLVYVAHLNGIPANAPSFDEQFVSQLARQIWIKTPFAELYHWNGDTGVETLLAAKKP